MSKRLLTKRWILTTLLVLAAMAVMVRLGFWQLDRLKQRRAFNARVLAQVNAPQLDLNQALAKLSPGALADMEYHPVTVTGQYDYSQQVAWRNQPFNGQFGIHLLTPLRITGSNEAILVDRGWIPQKDFDSGNLAQYDPPGDVTVSGYIRNSQVKPFFWTVSDPPAAPGKRLAGFYIADLGRISQQVPYPLLPVLLNATPVAGVSGLPYRSDLNLDLSEGPHLGYAIQWFAFSIILGITYILLIRKELSKGSKVAILREKPDTEWS